MVSSSLTSSDSCIPKFNSSNMLHNYIPSTSGISSNTKMNESTTYNRLDQSTSSRNLETGLKIGGNPFQVAVNPHTNMVYVIDKFSKKIVFIDGSTDRLINTVSLASTKPVVLGFNVSNLHELRSDIDIDPETNLIYATTTDSSLLAVIDDEGNKILNLPIVGSPFALSANNLTVYVIAQLDSPFSGIVYQVYPYFNRINGNTSVINDAFSGIDVDYTALPNSIYVVGKNTLYVFESTSFSPYRSIEPSRALRINGSSNFGLYDVGVNPKTHIAYMTDRGGFGSIFAANMASNNVTKIHVGHSNTDLLTAMAINPVTNKIYIANADSNTVSVLDGLSNCLLSNIPVGVQPRGLAVNPVNNLVYVANMLSGTVSVINGTTDKVTSLITFNTNPPNSGFIECNGQRIQGNFARYEVGTELTCEAKANLGFVFSS